MAESSKFIGANCPNTLNWPTSIFGNPVELTPEMESVLSWTAKLGYRGTSTLKPISSDVLPLRTSGIPQIYPNKRLAIEFEFDTFHDLVARHKHKLCVTDLPAYFGIGAMKSPITLSSTSTQWESQGKTYFIYQHPDSLVGFGIAHKIAKIPEQIYYKQLEGVDQDGQSKQFHSVPGYNQSLVDVTLLWRGSRGLLNVVTEPSVPIKLVYRTKLIMAITDLPSNMRTLKTILSAACVGPN
jgi:hypothetical protein